MLAHARDEGDPFARSHDRQQVRPQRFVTLVGGKLLFRTRALLAHPGECAFAVDLFQPQVRVRLLRHCRVRGHCGGDRKAESEQIAAHGFQERGKTRDNSASRNADGKRFILFPSNNRITP
jgi:hypothetical protein